MWRGDERILCCLLPILLGACGPTTTPEETLDAPVGAPVDAPEGIEADAPPTSTPDALVIIDALCGLQAEEIELINLGDPPDLLIVLDRSGSMMLSPNFPLPGDSKWNIMKNALGALVAAKENNIRFGLLVFPTNNDCAVDPGPEVPVALGNAAAITAWLAGHGPDGNTPAQYGLAEALATYESMPVNTAGRYVLFATDGVPNCGGDPPNVDIATQAESLLAVEDLTAAGIPTFVLGFGGILGLDPDFLNNAALAGGVPRPGGPPHYYHAEDEATLQATFDAIAGGIIVPSCSFALASPPPDPALVTVLADGEAVPRSPSHGNGWDYHPDANTITFFGEYCTRLQSGDIASVQFLYGCPGPIVE